MRFRATPTNQHAVMLVLMITTFVVIELNHMQASLQSPIAKATESVALFQRSSRMNRSSVLSAELHEDSHLDEGLVGAPLLQRETNMSRDEGTGNTLLQASILGSTVTDKGSTGSLRGAMGWTMETKKNTADQGSSSTGSTGGQQPGGKDPTDKESSASSVERQKQSNMLRIGIQLFFGLLYYVRVVRWYPILPDSAIPPASAKELQAKNEVEAVCDATCANNCLSFCCSGPRAAHTLNATGILSYWPGCVLMSLFPCCVLWITNSFTDLNEKLGGKRDSCCKGCLCAMFCSCCMIAKDAQTLDLITGCRTGIFSAADPDISLEGP